MEMSYSMRKSTRPQNSFSLGCAKPSTLVNLLPAMDSSKVSGASMRVHAGSALPSTSPYLQLNVTWSEVSSELFQVPIIAVKKSSGFSLWRCPSINTVAYGSFRLRRNRCMYKYFDLQLGHFLCFVTQSTSIDKSISKGYLRFDDMRKIIGA